MVAAATTSLSPLDQALLTRLFEDGISCLKDLFKSLSATPIDEAPKTLFALTQWAHQDHIKPWLDIHTAQHREEEQREMIALLKDLAKTSENPIERRRAATTILRALGLGAHRPTLRGVRSPSSPTGGGAAIRGGGGSISTPSTEPPRTTAQPSQEDDPYPDHTSPSHPITVSPPQPLSIPEAFANKEGDIQSCSHVTPDPLRSPQDVIDLTLHALQQPDVPERNTGPFTLFNLAGHIKDRTAAYFAEWRGNYLKNMVGTCWEFTSHSQRWLKLRPETRKSAFPHGDSAYALIDLKYADGSDRFLKIHLRRVPEGEGILKNCWLLKHLFIHKELLRSPYEDDPFNDTG